MCLREGLRACIRGGGGNVATGNVFVLLLQGAFHLYFSRTIFYFIIIPGLSVPSDACLRLACVNVCVYVCDVHVCENVCMCVSSRLCLKFMLAKNDVCLCVTHTQKWRHAVNTHTYLYPQRVMPCLLLLLAECTRVR